MLSRGHISIVRFRGPRDPISGNKELLNVNTGPHLSDFLHPEELSEQEEPTYSIGCRTRVSPNYQLPDHLWIHEQN